MKTDRRRFFQIAGAAGAGLMTSGLTSCNQGTTAGRESSNLEHIKKAVITPHPQKFNMCGYAAPKIDVVRIGFIGLGSRGPGAVERMSNIEGVEIKALCDKNMERVARGQEILSNHGLPAAKE